MGGGGSGTVSATADEVGAVYNIPAGAVVSTQEAVTGVTGVTNTQAAVGGTDPESDAALFARLDAYRKTPPTSGNDRHYHQWALEVNGIGAAAVIRCWDGPGTVKVIVADMELRPVEEDKVDEVAAYIETQRPVTAEVTVESAAGVGVQVAVTVETDGTVSKSNTGEMRVEQIPMAEIEENENNSYAQTGIDELAESIEVIGGCNGNLKGISRLLKGMKAEDAIARMEGTTCGPRPTSCPDQIAQNLKRALAEL